MRRRDFLRAAAIVTGSACYAPGYLRAGDEVGSLQAKLTIDETAPLATVPLDFMGLSYESAQLANPAFFSGNNTALIAMFRELSRQGVLRLGGGTSEFTRFTTDEPKTPPPFDAVGPDTSKNVKADTPVTPKGLRNLRGFLDETNWRCLYGLNLGRGTPARAAEEAFYAHSILGPRLIAFQLGNEPDAWRNRYRASTWSYADYWKEWQTARNAVVARVPQAKFAGPDVSNKMAYVTGFAQDAKQYAPDVVMLTSHYYAMGPVGAKDATIEKLLLPDPKLERDLKIAMDAARAAGLPYRMSEGNSCWNGGQPGVSDTLASALWATDMMLEFARAGCAGVNMHGGGNGYYTPIAGSVATGFTRRPEYFGMRLAANFVGGSMLQSTLTCSSGRVSTYAARKQGRLLVAAINKTEQPLGLEIAMGDAAPPTQWEEWVLSGPAIDARQGITIEQGPPRRMNRGVLNMNPYSAVLLATS